MYDFKRDFSYFIRKEVFVRKVPDISPIQVVNKIRPIGNNIRGTGGCTTKLAEQIRAFLGNPGLLNTKLAIRVKRFHEAHLK